MNSKAFKTLIKQAVKEVIQEELSAILKEAVLGNRQTQSFLNESQETEFSFNSTDVVNRPSSNNPLLRNRINEMYGLNTGQPVKQPQQTNQPVPGKLPFADLFAETAAGMTAQDRQALSRLD